jgi:hypothetical protein
MAATLMASPMTATVVCTRGRRSRWGSGVLSYREPLRRLQLHFFASLLFIIFSSSSLHLFSLLIVFFAHPPFISLIFLSAHLLISSLRSTLAVFASPEFPASDSLLAASNTILHIYPQLLDNFHNILSIARTITMPPFPYSQLFVLALCRICEPIAFMSIFPYIYYMIESFHIAHHPAQISVYAGLVTSAFTIAEFSTGLFWGSLSDRIGRKPVLLTGLCGTGLSMLVFGLATNLPVALVARALGGLLNGYVMPARYARLG